MDLLNQNYDNIQQMNITKFSDLKIDTCGICLEEKKLDVKFDCSHYLCFKCFYTYIKSCKKCHLCRRFVDTTTISFYST